jgi:uncharacterized membrane protein YidH (DUF202 family)
MASPLHLFGSTLFNVLIGLMLGYGIMVYMLSRAVPEAMKNETFLKYREILMLIVIVLVIVCMCLILFA